MANKFQQIADGFIYPPIGDDLVQVLRSFDPNFLLIANIPVGEFILALRRLQDEVARLNDVLSDIGDMAHDASTGPFIPDVLWDIRSMAYQGLDGIAAPTPISPSVLVQQVTTHPMEEEVSRLREALEAIMGYPEINSYLGRQIFNLARAALAQKEAP